MMRKYMTLGGLLVGLLVVVAAVGGGAPSVHGWDETQEDDQTGAGATPEGEIVWQEVGADHGCTTYLGVINGENGELDFYFVKVCDTGDGQCQAMGFGTNEDFKVTEVVAPYKCGQGSENPECPPAFSAFKECQPDPSPSDGGNVTTGGNGNLTSWGVASSTAPSVEVTPANIAPAPSRPDPRNFWTLR